MPVVRFESEYARLGGAANVAHNLAALGGTRRARRDRRRRRGGRPSARSSSRTPASVATDSSRTRATDHRKGARRHRTQSAGRADRLRRGRRRGGAVERAHRRTRSSASAPMRDVAARVRLPERRDHAARSCSRCWRRASSGGAPLLVDPKIPHLDVLRRRDARHAEPSSRRKRRRTGASGPTRTRGRPRRDFRARDGMRRGADHARRARHVAVERGGRKERFRRSRARSADVTGAGDTVVATLALALAAGASLPKRPSSRTTPPAVVVGKFGAATVIAARTAGAAIHESVSTHLPDRRLRLSAGNAGGR